MVNSKPRVPKKPLMNNKTSVTNPAMTKNL